MPRDWPARRFLCIAGKRSVGRGTFRLFLRAAIQFASLIFLLALVESASGHEVPVHRVMSFEAATRAQRLIDFLEDLNMDECDLMSNEEMKKRMTEGFGDDGKCDFEADQNCMNVYDFINLQAGTPIAMIQLGSILEDGYGNFCNHFYQPLNANEGQGLQVTGGADVCALRGTPGPPRDAKSWALGEPHDCENDVAIVGTLGSRGNCNSWMAALDEMELGLTASSSLKRKTYLARAFLCLGHVIHLVQDMTQPSHSRNDSHACRSPWIGPAKCSSFEKWGLAHPENVAVCCAELAASRKSMPPSRAISSLAIFSALNFFSESSFKTESSFNSEVLLSPTAFPRPRLVLFGTGLVVNMNLGAVVAFIDPSSFRARYPATELSSGVAITEANTDLLGRYGSLEDDNSVVLQSMAKVLYPLAVDHSAIVLNYFFRVRLEGTIARQDCSENSGSTIQISVRNISSEGSTSATANSDESRMCTLDQFNESHVKVLYKTGVSGDLVEAQGLTIAGNGNAFEPGKSMQITIDFGGDVEIVPSEFLVVYRGPAGGDEAVAACLVSSGGSSTMIGAEANLTGLRLMKPPGRDAVLNTSEKSPDNEFGCQKHIQASTEIYQTDKATCTQSIGLAVEGAGAGAFVASQECITSANEDVGEVEVVSEKGVPKLSGMLRMVLKPGQTMRIRTKASGLTGSLTCVPLYASGPFGKDLNIDATITYDDFFVDVNDMKSKVLEGLNLDALTKTFQDNVAKMLPPGVTILPDQPVLAPDYFQQIIGNLGTEQSTEPEEEIRPATCCWLLSDCQDEEAAEMAVMPDNSSKLSPLIASLSSMKLLQGLGSSVDVWHRKGGELDIIIILGAELDVAGGSSAGELEWSFEVVNTDDMFNSHSTADLELLAKLKEAKPAVQESARRFSTCTPKPITYTVGGQFPGGESFSLSKSDNVVSGSKIVTYPSSGELESLPFRVNESVTFSNSSEYICNTLSPPDDSQGEKSGSCFVEMTASKDYACARLQATSTSGVTCSGESGSWSVNWNVRNTAAYDAKSCAEERYKIDASERSVGAEWSFGSIIANYQIVLLPRQQVVVHLQGPAHSVSDINPDYCPMQLYIGAEGFGGKTVTTCDLDQNPVVVSYDDLMEQYSVMRLERNEQVRDRVNSPLLDHALDDGWMKGFDCIPVSVSLTMSSNVPSFDVCGKSCDAKYAWRVEVTNDETYSEDTEGDKPNSGNAATELKSGTTNSVKTSSPYKTGESPYKTSPYSTSKKSKP